MRLRAAAGRPGAILYSILLLASSEIACFGKRPAGAELILIHGLVRTGASDARPASAIAVRRGRLLAVGDEQTVMTYRGPTTPVVDLQGRTVLPGLIDAHVHLLGVGESLINEAMGESLYLDLSDTESEEDAVQRVRVRARTLKPGEWVVGRGWNQELWTGQRLPDKRLLSDIVPYNPAFLVRSDAHAVWVNRRALELAGLGGRALDPPGGRILRMHGSGEPSGVLLDRAWEPVYRLLPRPAPEEITAAILRALQRCAALGYTFVQSAGSLDHLGLLDVGAGGDEEADMFRSLALAGRLPIRVALMIPGPSEAAEALLRRGPEIGLGDDHLDIRSIELIADGALGSRGAALLQPYADDPATSGILRMSQEEIASWASRGVRHGIQIAVHAIGDAAVRAAARGFAAAAALAPGADARFRIEHLSLFDPADLESLERASVIASVQPRLLVPGPDGPMEARRVGEERARRIYAFGTLLEAAIPLAGSTDAFDRPVDPWTGIYAAVTREAADGLPAGGWHPEQRLKRAEALRLFTLGAAFAAFREKDAGSLEPGKWADFVVLSQDVMTVPEPGILKTEVLATYVAGRPVYQRERAAAAEGAPR